MSAGRMYQGEISGDIAAEIFKRLNSLDVNYAKLVGALEEREKSCAIRHTNLDGVCGLYQELKGAWKVVVGVAAVVGAVVGALVVPILKFVLGMPKPLG